MILTVTDIFLPQEVGVKARRLQQLHQAGYNVPPFVVLPVSSLSDTSVVDAGLAEKLVALLPCKQYAVRSAALSEDGSQSAMAGQFATKVAVAENELRNAIAEVVTQAQMVSGFTPGSLSVIVQEFVEPNYAGVLFTRNPLGGYEQVCEYVRGRGERVVSGQSSIQKHFFTPPTASDITDLPCAQELYTQAKAIEKLCGAPQDIEWVYRDAALYILQSRNITSLSLSNVSCYDVLETQLPLKPFFYEKTSVTETFSQPTPLALSFLQFLYAQNGPIAQSYASQGIVYKETSQFVCIGSDLYVDKQAETKALFPALGYEKYKSSRPKVESTVGLWTTINNTHKLRRLQPKADSIKQDLLLEYLTQAPRETIEAVMEDIYSVYPEVFKINLYGQLALGRLEAMAVDQRLVEKLLSTIPPTLLIPLAISHVAGALVGNSLSVDDTSPFLAQSFPPVLERCPILSHWKEKALLPKVQEVQNLMQFRELGRWVSVKLVSEFRAAAQARFLESVQSTPELLSYATLAQLQGVLPDVGVLKKQQVIHQQYSQCTFPSLLTNYAHVPAANNTSQMLSPGVAQGVLCTEHTISDSPRPKVLLVDSLTPNLTSYFTEVEGIICKQGGLLSHLAIMARETGLPVVQSSLSVSDWVGQQIEITNTGIVSKKTK